MHLRRSLAVALVVFVTGVASAGAQTVFEPPRLPDGKPDLQGVWDFRTLTPLQRPEDQADKAVLTAEEAAEVESQAAARTAEANAPSEVRTEPLPVGGDVGVNADAPAVKAVLVEPDSEWRWLHPVDGVDPADADPDFHTAFITSDYDDASWETGKDREGPTGGFGYGDDSGVDIGTPEGEKDDEGRAFRRGAYFRHRFTTKKQLSNLELRCQRDDGKGDLAPVDQNENESARPP